MRDKFKNILKSKLVKNSFWLLALQGVNTVLPILTIPYVTRILSASQYGYFSIGLNWIGYLQVVVEYGFGLSGSRKIATNKEDNESVIFSNIIMARGILCCITLSIMLILLTVLPLDTKSKWCMVFLFLMVLGTVLQMNWFFQGKEDMKYITIGNVLGRLITTILIFVFVKSHDDLYLYCILYSLNYVLMGFWGVLLARCKFEIRFVVPCIKRIAKELRDGWYVFLSQGITKVFAGVGVTYLGLVATSTEVGVYSAIYKIPYVLVLLWSPISQAIYPYISKQFEISHKSGMKMIKKIALPIILVYSIIGVGIIGFRYAIVRICFGQDYVSYADLIIPFILWLILGIGNNILGVQTLVASGKDRIYSNCFVISVIINLMLTFVMGRAFLSFGIAWASMISELILSALLTYSIKRERLVN